MELCKRISNEYSEPFDLVHLSNQMQTGDKKPIQPDITVASGNLTRVENSTLTVSPKKTNIKTEAAYLDDDSAYSSSCISQTISPTLESTTTTTTTSKCKGQVKSVKQYRHQDFDTEEDTLTTFDSNSYALNSSSSASSSMSPVFDRKCPSAQVQQQLKVKQCLLSKSNMLPVLSEYECVNDSLINIQMLGNDADEGKKSVCRTEADNNNALINAFDKLSTRCELIETSLIGMLQDPSCSDLGEFHFIL